jgi:hypothetical protein
VLATDERRSQIERAVLDEIIALHPDHLTVPELVMKMRAGEDWCEEEYLRHGVRELCRSGLARSIGEVIVPTHAALHFAQLLIWS